MRRRVARLTAEHHFWLAWMPAFAGMTVLGNPRATFTNVTPAQAGVHASPKYDRSD
jgi:hypothetical protein